MTDIRPSPEMLDAIAANRAAGREMGRSVSAAAGSATPVGTSPAAPLEERDLDAAIADHRLLYRSETGILKLHQRDGESGLGPPFNPIFAAFLDEQYGAFPWSKALLFLRWNVCRRTHTKHWERPEWRGSLCYELVTFVIRRECSLDYARLQLGLPEEGKTRRTLDSALLTIERRLEVLLSDDKARQSLPARSPAEWMAQSHVHVPLGGAHADECPNPACRGRSAA